VIEILNGLLRSDEITFLPKNMHENGVNNFCSVEWCNQQLMVKICSSPCFSRVLVNNKQ
jgi:hypothetical protein